MSDGKLGNIEKTLAFAAIVEAATGVALIIDPAIVVALLLGPNETDQLMLLGRVLGIALLALGLSCWPRANNGSQTFHGMLTYNLLIALFLAYVGAVDHLGGVLLWPAVVLHAAVALLLVWTWRTGRRP